MGVDEFKVGSEEGAPCFEFLEAGRRLRVRRGRLVGFLLFRAFPIGEYPYLGLSRTTHVHVCSQPGYSCLRVGIARPLIPR